VFLFWESGSLWRKIRSLGGGLFTITGSPIFAPNKNELFSLFETVIMLDESMGQRDDPVFATFLTEARLGKWSASFIEYMNQKQKTFTESNDGNLLDPLPSQNKGSL
jgi:hypothetical protein